MNTDATVTRKYAMSTEMRKFINRGRTFAGIRYLVGIASLLAVLPLSLFQALKYEDVFFDGKLFPSLLLSYAVSFVVLMLVNLLVRVTLNLVQEAGSKKLAGDPLAQRIASDFDFPVIDAVNMLKSATTSREASSQFTFDSRFHTISLVKQLDEKLSKYVSYVMVTSAPAKTFADELIVA